MLFQVRMDVDLPRDLDPAQRDDVLAREKAYSQELQRTGEWAHLWRIVGHYANISVFDVASNARLHEILSSLPLFPYMRIEVTPLTAHPSAI
ncbi:muconolactone Delta-isomerase [Nocardioides carbamazepini]|uniref:muconolactone Delta-isomerase n=1 Tax=Nocardioides carbamazepini TaxID=2854259 RepID=UPI00214A182D|nr:muconolactone Delta-isomerase [Nocardioides carbamazepini]MCR1784157.1 muconolactone Delta-isomerase [Nocardioides carbamazepini]